MQGEGVASGDILVVDRSVKPKTGSVVVAICDGEFSVRRLASHQKKESTLEIWGVVTAVVKRL